MGEWERSGYGEPLSQEEVLEFCLDFVPSYVEAGMPLPSLQFVDLLMVERPDAEQVALKRKWDSEYRKVLGLGEERVDGSDGGSEGPVRVIVRKGCRDAETTCLCTGTRLNNFVSSEGRMLPCMMMGDLEGPVTADFPLLGETTVSEILTDSTLLEATDSRLSDLLAANAECADCEYVMDCLGGCRMTALKVNPDTYLGIDPEHCKLFKDGWVERLETLADEVNERYARSHEVPSAI